MAQSAPSQMGAGAHGMGNASACLTGAWAMTQNIAGLASVKQPVAAFSCHAVPSFEPFNRLSAVLVTPIRSGAAGLSAFRFGDDLYNEHILSLGAAHTFGLASLGLKLNYIQYRAQGLETRTALSVSFGGIAQLTPKLLFGAHIVNINQPVIHTDTGERIPTSLYAGLAFKPSDKLILSTEIEKDLQHPATVKSGMEYRFYNKLFLRTGVNLHPEAGFFGLGFQMRKLQLDYALQLSHAAGFSHQASVLYKLKQP